MNKDEGKENIKQNINRKKNRPNCISCNITIPKEKKNTQVIYKHNVLTICTQPTNKKEL